MPRRNFKSVQLIFLLIFGGRCCLSAASESSRDEADEPPDGREGEDGAFFALRSCHRLLRADAGEFFSPDYLCSNPPLWCNWTIEVDPGKRIHLHLEDLTPDDTCSLKRDQIHMDEPAGRLRGQKVLQRCWREATYTSTSDKVHVVLLIGGWPNPPYRGFYGRYQAFGPPVVYNPQEGFMEGNRRSEESAGLKDLNREQLQYDYYNQSSAMTAEMVWEPEKEEVVEEKVEVDENLHPASGNHSQVHPFTATAFTQGASRLERGVTQTPSDLVDQDVHPGSSQQQNKELKPTTGMPAAVRWNVEEATTHQEGEEEEEEEEEVVSNQLLPPSERPEPGPGPGPEQTHPQPNMVEPLSDHRGRLRNQSEPAHLPGDHLFEVAVEVNFSADLDESWDHLARSLLLSVKTLINEQLETLNTPTTTTSKRIKRLNAGVLYILWLQVGQGPGGPQVHRAVHSALQGLVATDVGVRANHGRAVITSVSTADVNECGTQLVLCDVNADCVNRFGSYSCHCRPGFQDESRIGSGGTVCVNVAAAGCSSGLSAESKGVYVLFFLLSSLILTLLAAVGILYHRHYSGAFLVRCHSCSSVTPPDLNNNSRHDDSEFSPADADLPPPPPPARGFRDGWPQLKERRPDIDLPLLRFSPLLPPDGCVEPQEGGKM